MQNIFLNISTFGKPLKKGHPPTLEKSDPQCGFSEYIERTIEAHKQKLSSCLRAFLVGRKSF